MKTESAAKMPDYVLEPLEGNRVRVTLYTNEVEIETEEGSHFQYDMYVTDTVSRPALGTYISGNLDAWIAACAEKEREIIAKEAREARNRLIAETDYIMAADYPIDDDKRVEWAVYRQALRDVPEQPGFPYEIDWPHKPAK